MSTYPDLNLYRPTRPIPGSAVADAAARISRDEDEHARRMEQLKAEWGAEAVMVSMGGRVYARFPDGAKPGDPWRYDANDGCHRPRRNRKAGLELKAKALAAVAGLHIGNDAFLRLAGLPSRTTFSVAGEQALLVSTLLHFVGEEAFVLLPSKAETPDGLEDVSRAELVAAIEALGSP